MRSIFTSLLSLSLVGSAFAADPTPRYNIDADLGFSHDYGKQLAGSVLLLDVGMSPGITFLTGWVDNGSSDGWTGGGSGLLHYTCVIPVTFSGVHNGKFTGNYGKEGNGNEGGSPPVWHGAAQATAFKIVHNTIFQAPDGTPSDRTIVGICERVTLKTEPELDEVSWTCSTGGIAPATGATTVWKAPFVVGSPTGTVTATYQGKSVSVEFTIMTPSGITGTKEGVVPIPNGQVGVGMYVRATFQPTRVSYGGINGFEEDCPPTNRTGWFADHRPMNHVVPPDADHQWVGENNANIVDTCYYALDRTYQPPFPSSDNGGGGGSFVWRIPTNVEDVDAPANFRLMGYFDQTFSLFYDGEMHVNKYGVTERRRYVP